MLDAIYDTAKDIAVEVGPPILWAALWLVGGFWAAHIARSWVMRSMSKRSMGWNGTVILGRLVAVGIRIASILIALSVFGVSGTGLLAVASAFTVAIGLSLQDVLKNFFAGIYLLMERPFKAGDRIVIRDVVGEVQGIDIRTTLVKNVDDELVLVPNAIVFTEILRNDTHFGVRRLEFTITTGTQSLQRIESQIHAALNAVEGVKRPMPAPRITSSTPENMTVVTWLIIDNSDEIENTVAEAVIGALDGDAIEVVSK